MTFLKIKSESASKPPVNPEQLAVEAPQAIHENIERNSIDLKSSQRLNATLASRARFTNPARN